LTVTPDDFMRSVGAANPVLTGTIAGFKNGEDATVLTVQPIYSTLANAASPAGDYVISAAGAMAVNYDFVYGTGTLTVEPGDGGGGDGGGGDGGGEDDFVLDVKSLFDELEACAEGAGSLADVLCKPVFPSTGDDEPLYRFGPGQVGGSASLVTPQQGANALLGAGAGGNSRVEISLLQ
jgi:hypothetical protein